MEMSPATPVAEAKAVDTRPEHAFVQPVADEKVIDVRGDRPPVSAARESIRLAFVAALQPGCRPASAPCSSCARCCGGRRPRSPSCSTRASPRSTAPSSGPAPPGGRPGEQLDPTVDPRHEALLARYVDAFERYDIPELVGLLRDDVVLSMPPFDLWLVGADDLAGWFLGEGIVCKDGKLLPVDVNGTAGFGNYYKVGPTAGRPWAIQVIEVADGRIVGHHNFLGAEQFADFGLPAYLEAEAPRRSVTVEPAGRPQGPPQCPVARVLEVGDDPPGGHEPGVQRGRLRHGTPMSTWWARCHPVWNGTSTNRAGNVWRTWCVVRRRSRRGHAPVLGDGPQPVDDPPDGHPRRQPQEQVQLGTTDQRQSTSTTSWPAAMRRATGPSGCGTPRAAAGSSTR